MFVSFCSEITDYNLHVLFPIFFMFLVCFVINQLLLQIQHTLFAVFHGILSNLLVKFTWSHVGTLHRPLWKDTAKFWFDFPIIYAHLYLQIIVIPYSDGFVSMHDDDVDNNKLLRFVIYLSKASSQLNCTNSVQIRNLVYPKQCLDSVQISVYIDSKVKNNFTKNFILVISGCQNWLLKRKQVHPLLVNIFTYF